MKRRLDTIKGKRVVLTNNSNEIKYNEIGIIEKPNGKVEVKAHNNQGKIEDLASGSSDLICIGVKKPYLDDNSISEMNLAMLNFSIGVKYTNACYTYYGWSYISYEDFYSREYVMAIAILVMPEFPNNIFNYPTFSTFAQFRLAFIEQGFTEQEFDSQFYEISKEEFFTPFGEYKDVLTLQIDDKELIVDFAARKWFLTGEGWKDIDTETNTVSVVGLLRLPYEYRQVVYNNVKYETTTNNYVVYGDYNGSYTFTNSRLKTNGVGPDPNYPKLDGAEAFMHSSGIQVCIMM